MRQSLFALTKPANGGLPRSLAEALANLARNPAQNVEAIYCLTKLQRRYEPALFRMPDAWTVTVNVNDTGDDSRLFAGPGGLVFDDNGYAWITNNVVQGTTVSCDFVVVLKPNGQPADGANNTPVSPVTGGGLLGTGLGVTIAPNKSVWFGNFGWGGDDYNPSPNGNGSVSQFDRFGNPLSPPLGYQGGPVRVQGTLADKQGNIWLASFGTNSLFVFRNGNPNDAVEAPQYSGSKPFHVALNSQGEVWLTNGGGFLGETTSSVTKYSLTNGQLSRQVIKKVGKALKTVAVDSQDNAWVTSQGGSTIYAYTTDGEKIGGFSGGGIDGPWGICVDGEDNIWVGNFGPLKPGSNFNKGRVSKLAGANPATRPSGKALGDPISPSSGYTVHSAGDEVLLHDGTPLYGPDAPPSFAPFMRSTFVAIDQGGNLWAVNNWKPSFLNDALKNPGGDEIVIFVGLAPPPAK